MKLSMCRFCKGSCTLVHTLLKNIKEKEDYEEQLFQIIFYLKFARILNQLIDSHFHEIIYQYYRKTYIRSLFAHCCIFELTTLLSLNKVNHPNRMTLENFLN